MCKCFSEEEVQKSIIFDALINYLDQNGPFKNDKLFAKKAYNEWQEIAFEGYPFYFDTVDKITRKNFLDNIALSYDARCRIAIIDVAFVFALFLLKKIPSFEDKLTDSSQAFLRKLANKATREKTSFINMKYLHLLDDLNRVGSQITQFRWKSSINDSFLPKFSSNNPKKVPINIDRAWLLQIIDYEPFYLRSSSDTPKIATNYVADSNNKDYFSGQSLLGVWHLYVSELINDIEKNFWNNKDAIDELKNERDFFCNFFDYITTEDIDMNIPNPARSAANQAIIGASGFSNSGSYLANTGFFPQIDTDNNYHTVELDIEKFATQEPSLKRSFILNFKAFIEDKDLELDNIEWLESYILVRSAESDWMQMEFTRLDYNDPNAESADNFFDAAFEIVPHFSQKHQKDIVKKVINDKNVGLSAAIYEDSIYIVLAIDLRR